MDRMSSVNSSSGSGPKKFTKAVKQQAEFDDVYFEIIWMSVNLLRSHI